MSIIRKITAGLGIGRDQVKRKKDRRKGDRRFERNELKKPAVYGDLRQRIDRRKNDRRD